MRCDDNVPPNCTCLPNGTVTQTVSDITQTVLGNSPCLDFTACGFSDALTRFSWQLARAGRRFETMPLFPIASGVLVPGLWTPFFRAGGALLILAGVTMLLGIGVRTH